MRRDDQIDVLCRPPTVLGWNGPPEKCPEGRIPIVAMNPADVGEDGTIRAGAAVYCHLEDGKDGSISARGLYLGQPDDVVSLKADPPELVIFAPHRDGGASG